jgi:integrase
MNYLIKRNDRYYYNRRIPERFCSVDPRAFVRVALNTSDKKIAIKAALRKNDELEDYWAGLLQNGNVHSDDAYAAAVERSRTLGFAYHPLADLSDMPLVELISRLQHVKKINYNHHQTEAVLGAIKPPSILMNDCISRFWEYSKNKTMNKSPDQIRKWKNPRIKAVKNFVNCIGNKPIDQITRDDTLKFRDWWIERLDKENLVSGSANKDIIYIKTILESLSENLKLDLDIPHLFRKLVLSKDDSTKRLPFETSFIRATLLNLEILRNLNSQARCVLLAIAETGAGIAEQVGLLTEDIVLDAEIPHIIITSRSKKALKTKYRRRTIPLVGYALDAFKECPQGFNRYRDRPDALSALLSKYLRENNLLPSSQHTVYSLRHSFQDRLLAVNAPDRIQADLMGHKFNRPAYGDGASLEHKLEWLKKIQLKG